MSKERTVNSPRLYRQVLDKMLAILASGEYPPGSRLPPERELSERFGVSRPTIREAIIALEVKGAVTVKTGSGVYVLENRKLNGDQQQAISPFELTESRVLIEGEAAALAASMITEEQLNALAAAIDEMAKENEEGNVGSDVADRKFHLVIAQATQNRALIDTIEHLWDIQEQSMEIHNAHKEVCETNPQRRLDEHQAIYDALARGEPQAARLAMRKHFSRLVDILHDATEAQAEEEVRRKHSERRKRFTLNRLDDNFASAGSE